MGFLIDEESVANLDSRGISVTLVNSHRMLGQKDLEDTLVFIPPSIKDRGLGNFLNTLVPSDEQRRKVIITPLM